MDRNHGFLVRAAAPAALALLSACTGEPTAVEPTASPSRPEQYIVPPARTYVDVSAGSSSTSAVRSV